MHASAKVHLTSVTIWIRIRICIQVRDLDCHQTLIICSLAHRQPSLRISYKSVQKFLHKVTNRQTQTDKHMLLGGGSKVHIVATELPQLVSQYINLVGEATTQSR